MINVSRSRKAPRSLSEGTPLFLLLEPGLSTTIDSAPAASHSGPSRTYSAPLGADELSAVATTHETSDMPKGRVSNVFGKESKT